MKGKGQMCALLLAAAGGLLSLVPCRAVAQDAVQYQWVSIGERQPVLYAVNTVTGESAEWSTSGQTWIPVEKFKLPDWDDIRKRREAKEREEAERKAKEQAAAAERQAVVDAFWKALPQMPLQEKVAMAEKIFVVKYDEEWANVIAARPAPRLPPPGLPPNEQTPLAIVERLKPTGPDPIKGGFLSRYKLPPDFTAKDGDVFVLFWGEVQGGRTVMFFMSSVWSDNKTFFPAPETIVEDVKAEIARQKEGW